MKQTASTLLFFLFCFTAQAASPKQPFWLGGKAGFSFPSNIGPTDGRLGFNEVAATGGNIATTAHWFFSKRLSIGAEIGYEGQKGDEAFWNVKQFGEINTTYKTVSLQMEGNYYFSHEEVRPYCGISFGAFWLHNTLSFDSKSNGTNGNQSVSYKANQWQPGFAPQGGVLIELSKKVMLDLSARFTFIPSLNTQFVNDNKVSLVPHGQQNHVSVTVGLWFKL